MCSSALARSEASLRRWCAESVEVRLEAVPLSAAAVRGVEAELNRALGHEVFLEARADGQQLQLRLMRTTA